MDNCAYRPPNNFDICNKYLSIFDNIMLMGDFDIDFKKRKILPLESSMFVTRLVLKT